MIEFSCHACGKILKVKEGNAGKRCKCTKCKIENTVPGSEVVPPATSNSTADVGLSALAAEETSKVFDFPTTVTEQNFSNSSIRNASTRDPWFFTAVDVWAQLNIAMSILGMAVISFLITQDVLALQQVSNNAFNSFILAFKLHLVSIVIVFSYIAFWAMILVGLDAARSLRNLRENVFRIALQMKK